MALVVLSHQVIRDLLETLTRDDVERFTDALKTALHEYSTGTQTTASNSYDEHEQMAVHSDRTKAETFFMPLTCPLGSGVKVVTISSSHANPPVPMTKLTGSITLHSPEGNPIGLLHAQTLTAFRTALASSCLLIKRARVRTLTVFGAGLQAYWHIRLALLLRGPTIRIVNIINRRFSKNAKDLLARLYSMPMEVKEREGWTGAQFSLLTPGYGEYVRLQKENIRAADVIYCCTPSTEDLFDATILTNHEGRKKGRLIVAVGSYARDMRELPVELLVQVTRVHQPRHLHYRRHAIEGGVVVVDSIGGALTEAGEIIAAGLESRQLVELGELIMIRRLFEEEEELSRSSTEADSSIYESPSYFNITPQRPTTPTASNGGVASPKRFRLPSFRRPKSATDPSSSSSSSSAEDRHLQRWLSSGNVVYKSVGLGLMDLVVGLELVELANARGVGVHVEDFSSK
ncbi:UbiD family decarboxylase [Xylaria sp. CBS 124048]|nr:UbiD family decarboxylase [Xylaria sp. CBS 124048]